MSDAAGTWWLDEAGARAGRAKALAASGVDRGIARRRWSRGQRRGRRRSAPTSPTRSACRAGRVVAAGGGDAAVGAVGLGATRPGDAFISLGTASQMIVVSDVYRAAPEKLVHSFAHALPRRWYRMAAMLNGAGALAFVARLVRRRGRRRSSARRRRAIAAPARRSSCPIFPASGRRTTIRTRAASFFGLSRSRDARRSDARGDGRGRASPSPRRATASPRPATRSARFGLIGGGARSALWTRMIAAALDARVTRYRGGEAGPAFGAARLAVLAATGAAPETVCSGPADRRRDRAGARAGRRPSPPRASASRSLYRALRPEFAKPPPRECS